MAVSRGFGVVIAERRLTTRGPRPKPVVITLGKPRLPKGERDWVGPVRISGAGVRVLECGYGVDSMQAVATALQGIRYFLDKSGKSFEWLGMPMDDGGFMQFIPMLRPRLIRRLEKLVEAEVKRDTARLRRRHESRSKRNREGRAK